MKKNNYRAMVRLFSAISKQLLAFTVIESCCFEQTV